jgi:tetratricopeptide (TPR) repeat protein
MPWVEAVLGHALALNGQLDEALPNLERAVEDAKAIHFTTLQSRWLTWLSQAYLLAGRTEAASQRADQALELALERRERGNQVYARHQLAEIAVSIEPFDAVQAEAAFREAATLADELGMRPVLAHCHRGLAGLYHRMGRHEDAHDELAVAGQLYAAMGMTTWLAQAETRV